MPGRKNEIDLRIAKGNNCKGDLVQFLKNKEITRQAKVRVYTTILRPTLTYAGTTWTSMNKTRERLQICIRKIQRKIFDGK